MADPPTPSAEAPLQPRVLASSTGPPRVTAAPTTVEDASAAREVSAVGAVSAEPTTPTSPALHDEHPLVDVGWNEDPESIAPLVEGMSNDDVFMLIRRFNKVVWYLRASEKVADGDLDLAVAPDQEFSPNKFRSQLERLYISVIVRALASVKHVARIRSWNETTRTSAFCISYFALWILDFLVCGVLAATTALIVSPRFRNVMFPAAPISLVDSVSGEVTTPNAGVLGSIDSITGAPENMKGEAVESEASNFVTAMASIGTNIMTGRDPAGEPNPPGQDFSTSMQAGPNEVSVMIASAKDKAEGVDSPSFDKTKGPMLNIMWSKVRPAGHLLTSICDSAERFENALNPRPPFSANSHRLRLASAIVPLLAASTFITRDLVVRSSTFLLGIFLFGDPILKSTCHWLDKNFPGWAASVHLKNNLLRGVPTNPQLALMLLRAGEKRGTPIPPPPRMKKEPPQSPLTLDSDVIDAVGEDRPLGASKADLAQAAAPDNEVLDSAGGDDVEVTKNDGSKEPHRFLRFMKGVSKAGVKSAITFDKARAKLGHSGAKNRAGVIPSKKREAITGPYEFEARYEGHKGFLYFNPNAAIPSLAFNKDSAKQFDGIVADLLQLRPVWTCNISEIREIRKHSGYGFKSKLAAGWALDKELNDSLGLTDRTGNKWVVTGIPQRDALFNRLISVADQKWEVW